MRQHYFRQNSCLLLQGKLGGRDRSHDVTIIFSQTELRKATNSFHKSNIIGQRGYDTVYKVFLSDNRVVAIKKTKEVPKQVDQFTNEVIILSQINHRNVVKLLAETAGVLSYLHSEASTPIIHRDVKSSNILLDHDFTVKVSDFGASRLFPLDHAELTTLVQGTFGYLDLSYMQTSQLTEKSDVYSFGVVLVELLTGRKVVCNDRSEEERSLANYFLYVVEREELLIQILEDNVVREGDKDVVMRAALLAKKCLNVRGDEKPYMKEVEIELEALRFEVRKHNLIQTEHNVEDEESVRGDW
ncbi:hypothetical protein C2S53_002174 [Perilla frutescens var. hirtella]|uniref:Protein kinase domain-containing protein n=1 Tax=Perilla frutescens var. hirtella TaxID=608512 RepID=A0AAD4JLI1_PERFH|nr:hypothetical protein C2S53_002174 [Perilla frutescens var. hirtella]